MAGENLLLQFNPAFEDRSPQDRPARQTIFDTIAQAIGRSVRDMVLTPGDAVRGRFRHQPERPGEWSDYDEAMQQIYDNMLVHRGVDAAMNMVGAPGLTGGVPGVGSGISRFRYNPLTDPERMSIAQEQAVRKRGLGIPTGKDAPGWDFKRPEAEAGSWADSVARARAGWRGDKANALEAYRFDTNPLMTAADWDEMTKPGFVLGSGTRDPAAAATVQGIKAYHGSPHDFDRFDFSKIGTGEGAQAYGHGLYFAENEGVARSYRDALSKQLDSPEYWQSINLPPPFNHSDFTEWAQLGQKMRKSSLTPEDSSRWRELTDKKRAYEDAIEAARPRGHMYEVNIGADPSQFLNWDVPLSRQSGHVRNALERFGIVSDKAGLAQFDDALLASLQGNGPTKLPKQPADPMGGAIYESSKIVPGGYRDPRQASRALREAGIPGIRYLDQQSRFMPQNLPDNPMANEARRFLEAANGDAKAALKAFGESNPVERWATTERDEIRKVIESAARKETRNYVVFDDALVDIVRKYGIGGLSMLPPAVAAYFSHKFKPVDYDPFGSPVDDDPFAERS